MRKCHHSLEQSVCLCMWVMNEVKYSETPQHPAAPLMVELICLCIWDFKLKESSVTHRDHPVSLPQSSLHRWKTHPETQLELHTNTHQGLCHSLYLKQKTERELESTDMLKVDFQFISIKDTWNWYLQIIAHLVNLLIFRFYNFWVQYSHVGLNVSWILISVCGVKFEPINL